MLPTDVAILTLLSTGLIFAIIELGLSAYWVSIWDAYFYGAAPGILSFLLFASLWTALRTGFRLFRYVLSRRSSYSAPGQEATWVTVLGLVINAVTMIFWLSAFAAFDTELGGVTAIGTVGATLAFAVMLWLVFLALLSLNVFTACGVLKSDISDYATLRNRSHPGRGMESKQENGAVHDGPVPASEVQ